MKWEEEISCEIVPIPTSDRHTHALFFYRFCEQGPPGPDTSSLPSDHTLAAIRQSLHDTIDRSFTLVSMFDERVVVVNPSGRNWIDMKGSPDILVPIKDNVGFSFKLGPAACIDQSQGALHAKDVEVTEPIIQRLHLSPRCLIGRADLNNSDKIGITEEFSEFGNINVLTYNILAAMYVPGNHSYCSEWAKKWEYRRINLLLEIVLYDAHIVCLQEVQRDHFEDFFKPELAKFGYLAVYKKKTDDGVFGGGGYMNDGCAIFFRDDIFKQVTSYEIEFKETALPLLGKLDPRQRDEARVRLVKDNIALVVILEMVGNATSHNSSGPKICVANTHIFARPEFPDVKLLQVSDLLNEIEKKMIIHPRMPLFICGDINSLPGSDPYTLLAKGQVNPVPGGREEEEDPFHIYQHLKLHHSMNLASAYTASKGQRVDMIDSSTGEPSFTILNPVQLTLDYIFYSVDRLEVKGLLKLLDVDSLGGTLPSPLYSSDHIALMARFRIKEPVL